MSYWEIVAAACAAIYFGVAIVCGGWIPVAVRFAEELEQMKGIQ